jgi:hypothetical protein
MTQLLTVGDKVKISKKGEDTFAGRIGIIYERSSNATFAIVFKNGESGAWYDADQLILIKERCLEELEKYENREDI